MQMRFGIQMRLQWKGLQQMYTGSATEEHTGKRLSSPLSCTSGHRQVWQHSTCGWFSGGSKTQLEASLPRPSTAVQRISSWSSFSFLRKPLASSSDERRVSSPRLFLAFSSRLVNELRLFPNMNMKQDFFSAPDQHLGATTVPVT